MTLTMREGLVILNTLLFLAVVIGIPLWLVFTLLAA